MKTVIYENQRGLMFKNGKFIKMLSAGKYNLYGSKKAVVVSAEEKIDTSLCPVQVLLSDVNIAKDTTYINVEDEKIALHFVNNKFVEALPSGEYLFWNASNKHSFVNANIATPEVSDDVPKYVFEKMSLEFYNKIIVNEYQKALLYHDNRLVKVLEPGIYYFWRGKTDVKTVFVDTRIQRLDISGQEILTQDKVTLRINFICNFRFIDIIKSHMEIEDYREQIYAASQLILREYVGKYRIDEILDNKEQISADVYGRLKEKAKEYYIEIVDAGIKDIILPGEIRDIMNTVLVAEKRAQANVITRREEVASTRSLLNTAKIMDENKTLYRLKELEYMERICEKVGNINVGGNADILSELSKILTKGENNV